MGGLSVGLNPDFFSSYHVVRTTFPLIYDDLHRMICTGSTFVYCAKTNGSTSTDIRIYEKALVIVEMHCRIHPYSVPTRSCQLRTWSERYLSSVDFSRSTTRRISFCTLPTATKVSTVREAVSTSLTDVVLTIIAVLLLNGCGRGRIKTEGIQ